MTKLKTLKHLSILLLFLLAQTSFGQSKVAITIDDVPNTSKFKRDHFESILLNKLDSLNIPIDVFINEGNIYKNEHVSKNFDLLNQWVERNYIGIGNHSFSHSRYSDIGLDSFAIEIDKGESITRELSKLYHKKLKYFRFPYNDLGKDSLQQIQIANQLHQKNYIIAPFTIESSDWVFNYLYEYYLKNNQKEKAENIGNLYIEITLEYFSFFDSIAINQYGRHINQIYLCHDNSINADYIEVLVQKLTEKGNSFVSMEEAMKDEVYNQPNNYFKKWGISWVYRWMVNPKERMQLMRSEPADFNKIYEDYKIIQSKVKASKADFDWLLGQWERTNNSKDSKNYEHWSKTDDSYIGLGYTLQAKDTVFKENMRIIKMDGIWILEVSGVNENPTYFKFTNQSDTSFVCKNPDNEFPKKIKYFKDGKKLTAIISDEKIEIPFYFK